MSKINQDHNAFLIEAIDSLVLTSKLNSTLLFYHYDSHQIQQVSHDYDQITSLDYCEVLQKFIFGHQSGKISFAYYKNGCFQKLTNQTIQMNNSGIKVVKYLFLDQVFLYIDKDNKCELVNCANQGSRPVFYGILSLKKDLKDVSFLIRKKGN